MFPVYMHASYHNIPTDIDLMVERRVTNPVDVILCCVQQMTAGYLVNSHSMTGL